MNSLSLKSQLFCIFLAILTIVSVIVVIYIIKTHAFDTAKFLPKIKINQERLADKIKVGIIGDSWVAGKKLDKAIKSRLNELGFEAEVVSSGHPGAKSRQIYRDLFADPDHQYSSQYLLMDSSINYMVIIAGVNDTVGHIGKDFYSHHMLMIIDAIQSRGIHVVVVEVPEYNIENTPAEGFLSYMKRLIYRILFDDFQHNVIKEYRDDLRQQITLGRTVNMTWVSFDPIAENYDQHKDLYNGAAHLNKRGNQFLGELIAENIKSNYKLRYQEPVVHRVPRP